MTFAIKKIQESDIHGFHKALSAVVKERKYLLTVEPPVLEEVAKYLQININNNSAQYVALLNDEIVGWADIIPHSRELLRHSGILGIGVISQHRGTGIGRELMKCVIDHAWENGLKRIELEVFANNLNAVALYNKFGFKLEGTKRNARYINDHYEDVHFMAQCRL